MPPTALLILAAAKAPPVAPETAARWAYWLGGLTLVGLLLILLAWVLLSVARRRARAALARRKPGRKPIADAWEEAGRRMQPEIDDDIPGNPP